MRATEQRFLLRCLFLLFSCEMKFERCFSNSIVRICTSWKIGGYVAVICRQVHLDNNKNVFPVRTLTCRRYELEKPFHTCSLLLDWMTTFTTFLTTVWTIQNVTKSLPSMKPPLYKSQWQLIFWYLFFKHTDISSRYFQTIMKVVKNKQKFSKLLEVGLFQWNRIILYRANLASNFKSRRMSLWKSLLLGVGSCTEKPNISRVF